MPEYRLGRLRGGYCVVWYDGGKRHRHSLATSDPAEAKRKLADLERLRATAQKPAPPTVAELWAAYVAENEGRPIAEDMGFTWRALGPHFAMLDATAITPAHCRDYTAARRTAGRSDGTIWTELGHIRTVLRWAVKRRRIGFACDIPRPKKPPPRDRHLTREQAESLLDGATMPHIRLFITLALATGARSSALLELTWGRVDFERRLIHLEDPEAKGWRKRRAIVPMNRSATAALSEAQHGALTKYVIEWAGQRVLSVKKGLANAAKRAGLGKVSPHDLRHTAAVWMAEAGVPMTEVAQFLGHSDTRLTERVYARFSPTYLRGAANALEIRSAPSSHEPAIRAKRERK